MSGVPDKLYCIHCKKHQSVSGVKSVKTAFKSKRNGVACERESWQGSCGECKKNVQSFKKKTVTESTPTTPSTPMSMPIPK